MESNSSSNFLIFKIHIVIDFSHKQFKPFPTLFVYNEGGWGHGCKRIFFIDFIIQKST